MHRAVLFIVTALLFASCNKKPVESYDVRGQFITLSPGKSPATILFHHENMPEFKNDNGEKVGMMSMQMPFAVEKSRLIDGIKAGDKAELHVEVRIGKSPKLWVSGVKKLPEDTPLTLTNPY